MIACAAEALRDRHDMTTGLIFFGGALLLGLWAFGSAWLEDGAKKRPPA